MSIVEYTGPSNPQEIRKYLMRRTKEEIVHEYLRQWRYSGEVEKERDALAAHVERLEDIIGRSTLADTPAAESALDDSPATSLTRLKSEWQAELLGKVRTFDIHTNNGDMRHDAERRAGWNACLDELRRQAEGDEP